jgi:hypothetical protein
MPGTGEEQAGPTFQKPAQDFATRSRWPRQRFSDPIAGLPPVPWPRATRHRARISPRMSANDGDASSARRSVSADNRVLQNTSSSQGQCWKPIPQSVRTAIAWPMAKHFPFTCLNHTAVDSGILGGSANRRADISPESGRECVRSDAAHVGSSRRRGIDSLGGQLRERGSSGICDAGPTHPIFGRKQLLVINELHQIALLEATKHLDVPAPGAIVWPAKAGKALTVERALGRGICLCAQPWHSSIYGLGNSIVLCMPSAASCTTT